MAVAYAVVVPGRYDRSSVHVYARRRRTALVVLVMVVLALSLSVSSALANRGGAPASAPAVRPATAVAPAAVGPAPAPTYVVQPGDSLWTIAGRLHGPHSRHAYLDLLIDANHGTVVYVGQILQLP